MTKWLLRQPDPHAEVRLFCLPFAGIGASAFRLWPTLSDKIEICPVQLPGRENRSAELVYDNIDDLTNDMLSELQPFLDRPYALFGHCMGALIAYDFTLKLKQHGVRLPEHLYISASRAPHSSQRGFINTDLSDEELASLIKSTTLTIDDPQLLSILLPHAVQLLRKDLEMCNCYQPDLNPISCLITTFAWREDQGTPCEELLGWRNYGDVTEKMLEGDHFAVQNASSILLQIIGTDLNK